MAHMHHTDDILGLVSGATLAMVAHLVDWVTASTVAGELLQTVFYGVFGGAAGMAGKLAIQWLWGRVRKDEQK